MSIPKKKHRGCLEEVTIKRSANGGYIVEPYKRNRQMDPHVFTDLESVLEYLLKNFQVKED
jgi:hypothetical protein